MCSKKARGKGAPKKKTSAAGMLLCKVMAISSTNEWYRFEERKEEEVDGTLEFAMKSTCIKYGILKALVGVGWKPWEYTEFHDPTIDSFSLTVTLTMGKFKSSL